MKLTDPRTSLKKHLKANGITQTWVAAHLDLSIPYVCLIFNKKAVLTEENRQKLNGHFKTNY